MKYIISITFLIGIFIYCQNVNNVHGHAILDEPPSRSSAWRFHLPGALENPNDSGLNCGDFSAQWNQNDGKCGICGDPYNGNRENEFPYGKYARNPQTYRRYTAGQVITAKIHVVANHHGYYEFRLCPATDPHREVTQECLNKTQLEVIGSSDRKWWIPDHQDKCDMGQACDEGWINEIQLRLPADVRCDRCVFQWEWTTREYTGDCGNGAYCLGCGPQRTFRACSDIQIV